MDLSKLTPEQMAQMPAGKPPTGVMPNFKNPVTNSPQATAVTAIFLGLMVAVVAARLYSKGRIARKLGMDDWMALAAGLLGVAVSSSTIAIFNQGFMGRHIWDIPLIKVFDDSFLKTSFSITLLTPLCGGFSKLSIFFFILRLFSGTTRATMQKVTYLGIGLNIIYMIAVTLYSGIVCGPRPNSNGQYPEQCPTSLQIKLSQVTTVLNMFFDVYALAISIPTVAHLKLSMRKKIGVVLVFATGILALICSIIVLYYRVTADYSDDVTWNQVTPLVLSDLEVQIATITACLPALPALWNHIMHKGATSVRRMYSRVTGATGTHTYPSRHELTDRSSSERLSPSVKGSRTDIETGMDPYKFERFDERHLAPRVHRR